MTKLCKWDTIFAIKKVNTNKVGGKLMTLKEEMQKNRDEEITRMREEDIERTKNAIRKWFLDEQLKDKKESDFQICITWYEDKLILNYDLANTLTDRIVPEKAKQEFIEGLEEKLDEEGIEMNPKIKEIEWELTIKLS